MEINVAKRTGFCSGVQLAYNQVKKSIVDRNKIYIYGELVHNKKVIEELNRAGAITIKGLDDIPDDSINETVIIRAHGISKSEKDFLKKRFSKVIDMTCPIVTNLVKYVKDKQKDGFFVVVYGKPDHPEILGLKGNVDESKLLITLSPVKIPQRKILIVSQTTMGEEEYKNFIAGMVNINSFTEVLIRDTICSETVLREKETLELSKKSTLMLVIGGKNSSNTQKLYRISKKYCKRAYHIESDEELKEIVISPQDKIGIVTGSSTPKSELDKVLEYLRQKKEDLS
ncbi:MAG: 4-hydroxy-3-methylbut-2-en-yl diphosphate reductase [Petrotoga sp.]|nr:4-hydroxy-3-methylbut-2-en-yl diphosphate reductase [Petrotoga sp.]